MPHRHLRRPQNLWCRTKPCNVVSCFVGLLGFAAENIPSRLGGNQETTAWGPGLCAFCWALCVINCSARDYSLPAFPRAPESFHEEPLAWCWLLGLEVTWTPLYRKVG